MKTALDDRHLAPGLGARGLPLFRADVPEEPLSVPAEAVLAADLKIPDEDARRLVEAALAIGRAVAVALVAGAILRRGAPVRCPHPGCSEPILLLRLDDGRSRVIERHLDPETLEAPVHAHWGVVPGEGV